MEEIAQWIAAFALVVGGAVGIGALWCGLIDLLFNKARGIRQWWTGDECRMPKRIAALKSPMRF
jgi:hypothetical protein